ncbi:MAG: roadblock/LC7 domain-containing protein [Chitinivibrionales bacterium]|nr:roadblock/LC7 domain-containing protein [Chitinivibrionales bacterium]MBD3395651.1 roadblock/LC7 domain-containing protein [Chitinivibrionales bacterium]
MEHDVILSREDARRLNVVLTRLVDKARIDCVLLINKSGRLITSQSETSDFDRTALAALIAGAFASTTAVANMIGENEFTALYHQGKKRNTHICLVDDSTILTVLFDKRTTLDKVRHFIKEYNPDLRKALKKFYGNVQSDPNVNIDIGEAARTVR